MKSESGVDPPRRQLAERRGSQPTCCKLEPTGIGNSHFMMVPICILQELEGVSCGPLSSRHSV